MFLDSSDEMFGRQCMYCSHCTNTRIYKRHLSKTTSLQDSTIKDHILLCGKCSNNWFNENNFVIICKFKSEFCSKIHEVLY